MAILWVLNWVLSAITCLDEKVCQLLSVAEIATIKTNFLLVLSTQFEERNKILCNKSYEMNTSGITFVQIQNIFNSMTAYALTDSVHERGTFTRNYKGLIQEYLKITIAEVVNEPKDQTLPSEKGIIPSLKLSTSSET